MSNFAPFALARILQAADWPRKTGFLRKTSTVRSDVLDLAVEQLLKIGVTLGVGRPELALRLIADSFQREWNADSAQELVEFLNVDDRVSANSEEDPWRVIGMGFSAVGKEDVPYEWLGEPELARHYTGWFTQSLLWGVLHRQEGRAALETDRRIMGELADWWKQYGLDVSPETWPSNVEEASVYCEAMVNDFEAERRPLAETPVALMNEPSIALALADGNADG